MDKRTGKSTLLEAIAVASRQLTLLIEISRLASQGAQFIIASHSPILLGVPKVQTLSFDDGVIHECDYQNTESYQVTEMFINNREYFLKRLLDEKVCWTDDEATRGL